MSNRIRGATSVALLFRLTDVTTGAVKTGLDVTTLKLQFVRTGETPIAAPSLTLLSSETAAWTAYGAIEKDPVASPGVYRIDCPNAAFAIGADEVTLTVTSSAIQPATRLIDLTVFDVRNGQNGGLVALPGLGTVPIAGLTAAQAAAAILATPGNKLITDASGNVAANNVPTDYQQRTQTVTLPNPAPSGYGGSGAGGGPSAPTHQAVANPANPPAYSPAL